MNERLDILDQPCRRERGATIRHRRSTRLVFGLVLALAAAPSIARPQSLAGSRAASEMIAEGSVLVASGTAELLSTGAELAVVSARKSGRGIELVLRPVAGAASAAAELSATVTVEVSAAAWEAAVEAASASGRAMEASGRLAGGLVVAVPLATSAAATASVIGTALVVSDVVVGIVAEEELAGLIGRGVHRCAGHGP